ncbi:Uncharacterised protein [Salmonella enterica subsp. enterica serovar Bovismorbificans]|uniref:Uncharacterized protein n=1 Tax=Salmonella enterica subsp. enterica serovar Bovismorbificans TaxID=58097 RepID=A0A655CZH0_SALET|nr:Uncharacterised protein [Salmonella enterica subsp. enterica serovar Bovismorbificans]
MNLRIVNLRPVVKDGARNINRHITDNNDPYQWIGQDIFHKNLPEAQVDRAGLDLGQFRRVVTPLPYVGQT